MRSQKWNLIVLELTLFGQLLIYEVAMKNSNIPLCINYQPTWHKFARAPNVYLDSMAYFMWHHWPLNLFSWWLCTYFTKIGRYCEWKKQWRSSTFSMLILTFKFGMTDSSAYCAAYLKGFHSATCFLYYCLIRAHFMLLRLEQSDVE